MTKQQLIDLWQSNISHYSGVPQAALNYVYGDDSAFGNIPVGNYWGIKYEPRIVRELDGENSETAIRCLRATAALRMTCMVDGLQSIEILSRIGFTLKEILSTPLNSYIIGNTYIDYAKEFIRCFPGQAEEIITPEFLTSMPSGKNMESDIIAMFIAAELMYQNKDSENTRSDIHALSNIVYAYALNVSYQLSVVLLARIYNYDKHFSKLLKKIISNQLNGRAVSIFVHASESVEAAEAALKEMDLWDDYIFSIIVGELKAPSDLNLDSTEVLEMAVKRAVRSKNIFYQEHVCAFLCDFLKKGQGTEFIPVFEKCIPSMLSFMDGVLSCDTTHLVNSVKINPEKAAGKLSFKGSGYYWFGRIVNLCRFSLYSKLAHDVIFTLMKAAQIQYTNDASTNFAVNLFSSIMGAYCHCDSDSSPDIMLEKMLGEGISLDFIFRGISVGNGSFKGIETFISNHIDAAVEFYNEIKNDINALNTWVKLLYESAGCKDVPLLLELIKHRSKTVSRLASEIIIDNEELIRPQLEELMPELKSEALNRANAIIKKWDNNRKYGKDFTFTSNTLAEEFISDNYNAKLVKKIAFIPEELFNTVRWCDLSGNAPAELLKYILIEYMNLEQPYRIEVCSKLTERLHKPDLYAFMESVCQCWIDEGADTKKKMILVPYCVFASDSQILAMKKQLKTWAENSRGALAAFAVKAIALNGGKPALMMVNDLSQKFPNNQVKSEAKAAFAFAAEALGVPEDVLADKIVPDLGLDKNGETELDYGPRRFRISLMPDFTFTIFDISKNKQVKSLPKAAASDDAAKAEIAKKNFSDMKKQLKAVMSTQKNRLQDVLRNGRKWDVTSWTELFVDNPVMQRFAKTLVWGVYENEELISAFRYTDDGTFCDENDDEFNLPDKAEISLVHPCELEPESIEAWSEQLADYEIVQPFAQIDADVAQLDDKDFDESYHIIKYTNRTFTIGSMTGAAKKYNMIRGSVEDAGGYNGYHIQDKYLGIGMQIGSEETWVGQGYDETAEIGSVYFYKLDSKNSCGSPDSYSEFPAVDPKTISRRFVTSCISIVESILD